jgi:sulfite reductase beta subunit-like hemoprotein
MCCPVCDLDWRAGLGLQAVAEAMAAEFTPQSTAYWELWCDGERWGEPVTPSREEPFYGKAYLPRKFKICVGNPEDNCTDFYTNDLALEAVHENGKLLAFDVIAGGGMGHSTGTAATYPRLGSRIARIAPEEAVAAVRAVVEIHRDFSDRANRKHARLKYVVEERGAAWIKAELEKKLGHALPDAGPAPAYKVEDHLGWHEAQDGTLYVGLYILNGRLRDVDGASRRTGLREIVKRFRPQVRLTAKADVILAGIKPQDRAEIEKLIAEHGLSTGDDMGELRRLATACVALPTCNLALAEGERFLPVLLEDLERRGVGEAPVEIRLSGCPNSCVRTPGGEIGIAGRAATKYAVYLGGSQLGTRLAFLFRDMVERDALAPLIESLIRKWQGEVNGSGLSFGEWAMQKGKDALLAEVPVA